MEKLKYEVDPHSRLIAGNTGRKTNLPKFRKVLDGRFTIGKNNTLIYHVKSPVWHGVCIPHQLKLKGKWSLTERGDLRLTIDKWGRASFGDKITLKGDIISVSKNSLLFAITKATKENKISTYALKLEGTWQADRLNRLTFRATKEEGRHDILTLTGIWKIDKNYRIIYCYEKADLIRKTKKVHTLTFKGYWNITDNAKVSYVIDKRIGSAFKFKAGLAVLAAKHVKFELNIGLTKKQALTFAGTWKIGKAAASFRLRKEIGEKGLTAGFRLSRKIQKQAGEMFLAAGKSKREASIFAGAGYKW